MDCQFAPRPGSKARLSHSFRNTFDACRHFLAIYLIERRSRRKRSALQTSAEAPGPAGRLAFPNQGITGKEPDPFSRIGVPFGCRNATHHIHRLACVSAAQTADQAGKPTETEKSREL